MMFIMLIVLSLQVMSYIVLRDENEQLRRRLGRLEGDFDRHTQEKKS